MSETPTFQPDQLSHKLEEARKVHHQEKGCKNGEYVKLLEALTAANLALASAVKERDELFRNPDISVCSMGHRFRTIASHPAKSEREWECPHCAVKERDDLRAKLAEVTAERDAKHDALKSLSWLAVSHRHIWGDKHTQALHDQSQPVAQEPALGHLSGRRERGTSLDAASASSHPQSVTDREDMAHAALMRDIAKARENHSVIIVAKTFIPDGAKLVECYETRRGLYVIGIPDSDDPSHNCDEMGCGTLSHVIARFSKDALRTNDALATPWRLFGTEPRNGSDFLAWREDAGVIVCNWQDAPDGESQVLFYGDGLEDITNDQPTFWMPLPEGPSEPKASNPDGVATPNTEDDRRFNIMPAVREEMRELRLWKTQTQRILADGTAVHINMLRGTIAKPTTDQLLHVIGNQQLSEAWRALVATEGSNAAPTFHQEGVATCNCWRSGNSGVTENCPMHRGWVPEATKGMTLAEEMQGLKEDLVDAESKLSYYAQTEAAQTEELRKHKDKAMSLIQQYTDEIAKLKNATAEIIRQRDAALAANEALKKNVDYLRQNAEGARQALIRFGKHEPHCMSHHRRACDCGFAEVLK